MKDDRDGDKELFTLDVAKLEECREICVDVLQHPELPHEFRVLLNIYMSACREDDLACAYLRQALAAVVQIEKLQPGVKVPARAVIETKLKWIEDHRAYLT